MDIKDINIKDINFKKLAIDIGFSYLNGGYGYWENSQSKLHSYDSMDNNYLDNCIKFVDKGINEIKSNEYGITNDVKNHLLKMMNEEPSEKDIKYAKKQILEILKEKKKELKEYRKRRKS